ncbi:serologically defined colon cancer antigen 8 homolog [Pomacea canaliculata]|uniref:serologically defined colon cancer antigen 8 homolog n=1 Tax=Pomacea canaliculata TaxID=400727 RepID=UPI000D73CA82|nr:serologically defined colon cancer antigen 8 homolog [Pomacea canaliculata]
MNSNRAKKSLDELRQTLSAPPQASSAIASSDCKQKLASLVQPRVLNYRDGQPQFSEVRAERSSLSAAHTLRQMLDKTQELQATQQPRDAPSAEEVASLLQHHVALHQQVDAENRYAKEELAVLRMKLSELVDENMRLHSELKRAVVHEILQSGGDFSKVVGSFDEGFAESLSKGMNRHDSKRWQVELERLSRLHSAKVERSEAQLEYSKSEVNRLEQVVEDLKSQLRMQDTIPTHDLGLGDTPLYASAQPTLQTAIDRISKERDELLERVSALSSINQTLSHREEELYQQVKKSIALVEQAQLEQTEALVQKEQLAEELEHLRERFEQHVRASQMKIQQEREAARQENQFVITDLNKKLSEQAAHVGVLTEKLEKEGREKAELSAQLLEVKGQLRACDREVTMAAENYRAHSTSAILQRSSATQEAERLRAEYEQLQRERDKERALMHTEMAELRRRVNKAEKDLLGAKEECLLLTSNIQALERELHLAKLTREGIERGRAEDLKLLTQQFKDREEKLKMALDDSDDKHAQQVHEMDSMLRRQNKLILKLRDACQQQTIQLTKLTKKYRAHCGRLKIELETTSQRLQSTVSRLNILEEQADQHSRVHNKMAARLKAMDEHAKNQATQLLEILAANSRLTRDRQLLAKEVEFLRFQLSRINTEEIIRLNSSSKPLVDDILNAITKEERENLPATTFKITDFLMTAADFEDIAEEKEKVN